MPQLSSSQRYKIEALNSLKYGVTKISEKTGIPKCTVSRELARNQKNGRYDASRAEKMRLARCKRSAYKMKGELLKEVKEMLGKQYSPEQIWGRLALFALPGLPPPNPNRLPLSKAPCLVLSPSRKVQQYANKGMKDNFRRFLIRLPL